MDTRETEVAALANAVGYDSMARHDYVDGAPHIKHAQLRNLYSKLVVAVYDDASQYADPPSVLDLGAGEGSVTLPFLALGAKVTTVDISQSKLKGLSQKCAGHAGNLEVVCQDVHDSLEGFHSAGRQYDVVVANSFSHHIPDYLEFVRQIVRLLSPRGQFFSFQDPLQYDSLGRFVTLFNNVAYACWRIGKGDVIAGLRRRFRRAREDFWKTARRTTSSITAFATGLTRRQFVGSSRSRGSSVKSYPTSARRAICFKCWELHWV